MVSIVNVELFPRLERLTLRIMPSYDDDDDEFSNECALALVLEGLKDTLSERKVRVDWGEWRGKW